MHFTDLLTRIIKAANPTGPKATPLFALKPLIFKVYIVSAVLSIANAGPLRWLIAGIGILLLHAFGNWITQLAVARALRLQLPKMHATPLPAVEKRALRLRRLMQWLLLILLVCTMWDYGFSQFIAKLDGPGFEINGLCQWLMTCSPVGLICLKFGGIAFYCGLMYCGYTHWLARLGVWLLVIAYTMLMAYWVIWFAFYLSNMPVAYWKCMY